MARKKQLEEIQLPNIDQTGYWIMIVKRPTCECSPPKLSIHWSVPWPNESFARMQVLNLESTCDAFPGLNDGVEFDQDEPMLYDPIFGKAQPNWMGARRIRFMGRDVRIFPHEFSKLPLDRMRMYVLGYEDCEGSHTFVAGDSAGETLLATIKDTEQKFVYDAALLDGCTPEQATIVALGGDITDEELTFPPIGWYQVKPEFGLVYCSEEELALPTPVEE